MNGGTCIPYEEDHTYFCNCPENLQGVNCTEAAHSNVTYLVIDDTAMWSEAQEACEGEGFNLTSITNDDEMNFLSGFVGYVHAASGSHF